MRDLDLELRELALQLDFPETPDLALTIRAALPAPKPRQWRPRRLALVAAVVAVAVVAGLAAVPQARTAILRFFGIGAVRIEYVDGLPAVPVGAPLSLGTPIRPDEAPFRPLRSELLGEPDGMYLSGNIVTLRYGSPESPRLIVTQIGYPALRPDIAKKVVGSLTNTEFVQLTGSVGPGLWIEGEPHVLILPGAPERLAANTLIWTRGDLTLRVEGAATLEQAIEIAESLR